MQKKSKRQSRRGWQGKSMAERVSFGVSLSIVGIVVALICFAWITGDTNPPILAIATESKIREISQQYYVPFTVSNSGGETAESVEVTASLWLNNKLAETGRQEIDFLSRQEKRSGEFIFTRNPQQGKLIIRVASYKLP